MFNREHRTASKTLPVPLQIIIMEYCENDKPKPQEENTSAILIMLKAAEISSKISSSVYNKLTNDELQIQENLAANAVACLTFIACLAPSIAYTALKEGSMFAIKSVKRCIKQEEFDNIFLDAKRLIS